jgi:hypothetical protein
MSRQPNKDTRHIQRRGLQQERRDLDAGLVVTCEHALRKHSAHESALIIRRITGF